jgi:hypothetical protein
MKKQTPPLITTSNRAAKGLAWLLSTVVFTTLTITTVAQVPVFTNVWNVSANAFPDLPNAGNNVRGIAVNPLTTNVLFASSAAGTNGGASHVATLAFADGSNYLAQLNGTGFGAGTVATAGIRVSEDGFVYACNVSGAPASTFKIWRWPSDTDVVEAPTVVYNSGTGTSFQWRLGDYIDLRGTGIDTEIVVVGPGSGVNITTNFVIFRPTDNTATAFTNFSITIPGSTTANFCGAGVTFEGTNNAIWIRRAGSQETRRVAYDPTTLTATVTATNTVDQSACQGLKYFSVNGIKMLATLQANTAAAAQIGRVFLIPTNTSGPFTSVLSSNLPTPFAANGNGLGNVDYAKGYLSFGAPNNGISLYHLTGFVTNVPPSISANPGGATVVQGFNATLTVNSGGSAPLAYQWYFNTNAPIADATNSSVTLSNLQLANAGAYNVIVTNLYGRATSSFATVTVLPAAFSQVMTQKWNLAPGSRNYLANDNNQRGLAYAPVSERVVLVSRTPTNGVHLLDASTGADLGDMDQTWSFPGSGTFAINLAGAGDDGAVYVCNLTTSAGTSPFIIYSWSSASNSVEGISQGIAFNDSDYALSLGAGGARLGDTFAARGSSTSTELLAAYRTGTNVVLFTTADGVSFVPNILAVTNLPPDATANGFAGLGLAFGPTNTFWAKSSGFNLRLVQYDLAALTANVIATYTNLPGVEAPIGVDNANGLIAAIGVGEIPQNLAIYDLSVASDPALVDRELFPSNNANANGTGAASFDIIGGRLFSLDSNNGIIAMNYAGKLHVRQVGSTQVVTWPVTAAKLQSSSNVLGTYVDVIGATSPYTNTAGGTLFFRLKH